MKEYTVKPRFEIGDRVARTNGYEMWDTWSEVVGIDVKMTSDNTRIKYMIREFNSPNANVTEWDEDNLLSPFQVQALLGALSMAQTHLDQGLPKQCLPVVAVAVGERINICNTLLDIVERWTNGNPE